MMAFGRGGNTFSSLKLLASSKGNLYPIADVKPGGTPLQRFTAIGTVVTGEIYQVTMSPEFKPYRVDVKFLQCQEAAIKPLFERLSFIKNKAHWGAAFRFGQIKVSEQDFSVIAEDMGCGQNFQQNAL